MSSHTKHSLAQMPEQLSLLVEQAEDILSKFTVLEWRASLGEVKTIQACRGR